MRQLSAPTTSGRALVAPNARPGAARPRHHLAVARRAQLTAARAAATDLEVGSHNTVQHVSLVAGLGSVGEVSPTHLPWLLRLAHVRSGTTGGDSVEALKPPPGHTHTHAGP
ncbi:hypothetical protein TSOC_006749 [Tetrabaena socialis]|uniref:Uncharacterized protein n=1 Tax=Tetrabaena socialis TaxID=47790 RepID=A0A2J8A2T8_9CHLO|nr:hypothetical protein TSOC_006749 [Tetrabaena socialis]|eukprot:PNH06834.1 hypothetical protein TSOC_006749 [Tetrabaena socialis]